MNTVQPENTCGAHAAELTRLACGEGDRPSAALAAHARNCPECRAWLDESAALVDRLSVALQPEPLAPAQHDYILARALSRRRTAQRGRPWMWRTGLASLAAAAAVLLLISAPDRTTSVDPGPAASSNPDTEIALTEADLADILQAYVLVDWSAPEDTVDSLAARVEDVRKSIRRTSDADSYLPWSAEDDWDLPADDRELSARAPSKRLAEAGGPIETQRRA